MVEKVDNNCITIELEEYSKDFTSGLPQKSA